MDGLAWIDGQIRSLDEPAVPLSDLGLLRGLALFETLRTYGGHPHALGDHLARLEAGARGLGVPWVRDDRAIRRIAGELGARIGVGETRILVLVTGGDATHGLLTSVHPRMAVIVRPLDPYPQDLYDQGVRVVTFSGARAAPQAKTVDYAVGIEGWRKAQGDQAHEAIYVDEGLVREGLTSNVAVLRAGVVRTPDEGVLPGITRSHLRGIAFSEGLAWDQGPLSPEELTNADEVWLFSTIRELLPVTVVDGHPVGNGKPGPWGRRLRGLFQGLAMREAAQEALGVRTGVRAPS